jgi:hypothetical protein
VGEPRCHWRWTLGLTLGIVLGVGATLLGMKADNDPPNDPKPVAARAKAV